MEQKLAGNKVAVIGLGLSGIGTLKNLLEEGFDAVGFERSDHVGGLWHWSTDPDKTTALKSTRSNNTKQRNCYQDFPFPDDVPDYPFAADVAKYCQSYVKAFQLDKEGRCRLSVKVRRLRRSEDGLKWTLELDDKEKGSYTELFDRVVVTNGTFQAPFAPKLAGSEHFKGRLLHSQAFKDPTAFEGQRVVVVGLNNTAADIAVDLCGVGATTFTSHRSRTYIIGRMSNGKPLDQRATRRVTSIVTTLNTTFPILANTLGAWFLERGMYKANPSLPSSWRTLPARPLLNAPPAVNDHFLGLVASQKITSLPSIKRFLPNGTSIEFADGTVLDSIDAVILGTGYQSDYSILAPEADPTSYPTPEWDSSPNNNGLLYPRLYQGIFSLKHPQTLAFIGPFRGHSISAFSNADLSSQVISQIWKGNFTLPPQPTMESWCSTNYASALAQISKWHIGKIATAPKPYERWLNDAAGNGMNETLGWTKLAAWRFWWHDRKLYKLVMDGIDSPFVYRLFESPRGEKGRKKWDGAREAIFKVNGLASK